MIKRLGYKIDKVPLYYMESLMSKNFYNETPDIEYSEFLMLIFRISIESKFDLEKTLPKMVKASSQKKASIWGFGK
jgi:hypothetical protein